MSEFSIKDTWEEMKRAMYNGLSYMIPLVAGGGILIAIGTFIYAISGKDMLVFNDYMYKAAGGYLTKDGFMNITFAELDRLIFWLGKMGFYIIPEFMAAFTAYALVGKPGVAPGFILGTMANKMGGNFLGGIIAGWIVGYLVRFTVKKMSLKGGLRTVTSFVFIPIMAILVGGLIYRFSVGLLITNIMDMLTAFLTSMHNVPGKRILLAVVMGAMVVSDLGGPIGKVSVLFGLGVIGTDLYPHTFNHIAIPTSGAVFFLAYLITKKAFNATGRQTVINNGINCFFTVTEGGLPLLFQKPQIVLPSTISAGAISAGLAAYFQIKLQVPLGFWLALPFVNVGNGSMAIVHWILSFAVGVLVGTAIFTILLRRELKKNDGKPVFLDDSTGMII
ncbi:hypothetical protein [Clostridium oceanicum]|uniref:PTS EIIC type-2 domain-containing protein n=1 Tax=Clostridium oceanicum TaxID=1543 RepID=A0ABP3UN36_9CLOT